MSKRSPGTWTQWLVVVGGILYFVGIGAAVCCWQNDVLLPAPDAYESLPIYFSFVILAFILFGVNIKIPNLLEVSGSVKKLGGSVDAVRDEIIDVRNKVVQQVGLIAKAVADSRSSAGAAAGSNAMAIGYFGDSPKAAERLERVLTQFLPVYTVLKLGSPEDVRIIREILATPAEQPVRAIDFDPGFHQESLNRLCDALERLAFLTAEENQGRCPQFYVNQVKLGVAGKAFEYAGRNDLTFYEGVAAYINDREAET